MLEAHEWDDVLGRLVGVQFRGTKRIASATILDALGVAQDKEARQKARKRARSRPCMMLRIRISRIKRGAFGRLATRRFSPKLSVPIRLTPALLPHRAG